MRSEWGLGPLTIGSTNSRRLDDPPVAASGLRRRGQSRNRQPARADERRPAATQARPAQARADGRTTAPNPGTSWRGELGEDGRPDERSASERSEPERPVSAVDNRE
jgi:hypothetical protein